MQKLDFYEIYSATIFFNVGLGGFYLFFFISIDFSNDYDGKLFILKTVHVRKWDQTNSNVILLYANVILNRNPLT